MHLLYQNSFRVHVISANEEKSPSECHFHPGARTLTIDNSEIECRCTNAHCTWLMTGTKLSYEIMKCNCLLFSHCVCECVRSTAVNGGEKCHEELCGDGDDASTNQRMHGVHAINGTAVGPHGRTIACIWLLALVL